MTSITGELKFMQLALWIPKKKIHAQPEERIIESLGLHKRKNSLEVYLKLVQEYQSKTGEIICKDERGSVYFPADESELEEYYSRVRRSRIERAKKLLPELRILMQEGYFPLPDNIKEAQR